MNPKTKAAVPSPSVIAPILLPLVMLGCSHESVVPTTPVNSEQWVTALDTPATPKKDKNAAERNIDQIGAYAHHYGMRYTDYDSCLYPRTLCVDTSGATLPFETMPDLHTGESLKVLVFAKDSTACPLPAAVPAPPAPAPAPPVPAAPAVGSTEPACVFQVDAPTLSLSGAMTSKTLPAPGAEQTMTQVASLWIPLAPASPGPLVLHVKTYKDTASNPPLVDAPVAIAIGSTGYYFEPTLLFPTTFRGSRTITSGPLADGREEILGWQQSALGAVENLALGANVYPFGFPGSCVGGRGFPGLLRGLFSVCSADQVLHPLALQVAVSVSNNAFRNYYAGAGYTVIRGVSITGGMAFVQGQFFGPSLFPGEIIATPSGGNISGIETKYMIRPYFGVAITPALITLIINGVESIKSLAPTQSSNQPASPQ